MSRGNDGDFPEKNAKYGNVGTDERGVGDWESVEYKSTAPGWWGVRGEST